MLLIPSEALQEKIEALVQGLPVVEYSQGRVAQEIESLWQTLTEALSG